MAKKMTMADIASLSGVGKSTVSRYFNGGYVKDETRAKIQKVIEEYNYTPNAFARLNAKQSNVIGVVVPTLNSKITSRVITSIDRYLREKGYTTLIQNSDHNIDPAKCRWNPDQFHSNYKRPQRTVKESRNTSGCLNTGL